ncbi:hypothetical protein [Sphingomonas sp. R86520]|uniref:hypothetical protein n=1 Tax=Sphingomonas sp. R86520 TaxID=3093859 RepID=UPI0036D22646
MLLLGAASQPQQQTDDQLIALVGERARAAAARWGLAPIIRAPAGGGDVASRPDGSITVPLGSVRRLLRTASEGQARAIVGWLLAHEVWHQLQFRDGWNPATAQPVERRRKECVADTMGAYAVLDDDLADVTSAPTPEATRALGTTLARVADLSAEIEAGQTGANDHPAPAERRAALRIGFARALQGKIATLSPDSEGRVIRDQLASLHDIRTDEPVATWADRTCSLLLHDGDGVSDLASDRPTINWNRDGNPAIVTFRIPFRNTADVPIHATLQVRSVSVPRISPDDRSTWALADVRNYTVTLAPRGQYDLTGTLRWVATDTLYPKLVYPTKLDSLYNAVRLTRAPRAAANDQSAMALTSEPARLKGQLQTIYNAARGRFGLVSQDCETLEHDRWCKLRELPVGVTSGDVIVEGNGSSRVELTIYRGSSVAESVAAYRRFHGWLRAMYPALQFQERSGADRDSATMSPSPLAILSITRRKSRSGDHVVEVTIEPIFV